jgi:hypothetical protein
LSGNCKSKLNVIADPYKESDMAQARISALERELRSLCATREAARRVANLVQAQQLAEEARRVITEDYANAAGTVAEIFTRLAEIAAR